MHRLRTAARPRRSTTTALLLALVAATLAWTAPSAQAVGTAAPTIVTPTDGSNHLAPYSGTLTVDFSQAPTGTYTLDVSGFDVDDNERTALTDTFTYDGSQDTYSADYDVNRPGRYYATVTEPSGETVSSQFTVYKTLKLAKDGLSAQPFYPLVHDGYRDRATARWTANEPARKARIQIVNAAGHTVLNATGDNRQGTHSFTWNGHNAKGDQVAPGKYKLTVTAFNQVGPQTATLTYPLEVATAMKVVHGSDTRNGYQISSRARSAGCYVNRYSYSHETDLDCWGGKFAAVGYGFHVPASAYNVTYRISGGENCCDGGTITRTGTRVSKTSYRVGMRVTHWRSYTITGVRISYAYKKRI